MMNNLSSPRHQRAHVKAKNSLKRFAPSFCGSNQAVVVSVSVGKKQLNPQKLLMSKWTAVESCDKEKHFLVARVINPEAPRHNIQEVEMEAVMTTTSRQQAPRIG